MIFSALKVIVGGSQTLYNCVMIRNSCRLVQGLVEQHEIDKLARCLDAFLVKSKGEPPLTAVESEVADTLIHSFNK